jgi:TetR/AcrR family transcriptional regulator, transcriptional repressor for nem operon
VLGEHRQVGGRGPGQAGRVLRRQVVGAGPLVVVYEPARNHRTQPFPDVALLQPGPLRNLRAAGGRHRSHAIEQPRPVPDRGHEAQGAGVQDIDQPSLERLRLRSIEPRRFRHDNLRSLTYTILTSQYNIAGRGAVNDLLRRCAHDIRARCARCGGPAAGTASHRGAATLLYRPDSILYSARPPVEGNDLARSGSDTRTAIMDAAEALILEQGFAATAIDRVIERAGITKGTFFYHFKSKAELAYALVERYAALDAEHLERNLARAERLGRDPLQQVLIFVGLFREEAAELTEPYPGCLFASYCYEAQLFDERTLGIGRDAMRRWRERFGTKLAQVTERHPPRLPTTGDSLADTILTIFEGAFILSRTLNEPQVVADQLGHYRNYLELLFSPER